MTLLGEYEDNDYLAEFGTLVVRDTSGEAVDAGLLAEYATDGQPCGTIARTGHGWLEAAAGDPPCLVRLRVHDGPPAEARSGDDGEGEWDDLVELPYRSATGVIGLTDPTGGPGQEHLRLGDPGLYRVRVAHRDLDQAEDAEELEEPESLWQLDFWAVPQAEPPRWLRRSEPAVRSAGDRGWKYLLGYQATALLDSLWYAKEHDAGTSLDELAQWGSAHSSEDDWLDQPLIPTDYDHELKLEDVATQLGRPAPTTRRTLLPLFAALGFLTFDGDRYLHAPSPPRPQDVLTIPAELLTNLELSQSTTTFTSFASDLITLAWWGGADQSTAANLAERTLTSESDVRGALDHAVRRELVRIDGDLAGKFTVVVLPAEAR